MNVAGLRRLAAGGTLIASLASIHCAPMRETRSETALSTTVARVAERRDGRSGLGWFRVRSEGDKARIEWIPSCSIVRTEHVVVREDVLRHPDTVGVVLEIATAAVGTAFLAYSFSDGSPSMGETSCSSSYPPQCESKSGLTGMAFIAGTPLFVAGGVSAAVDLASRRRETRIKQKSAQVADERPVPCRQIAAAGIRALLVIDHRQYSGGFDAAGVATITIPASVWEKHPKGLEGTLLLDGATAGSVLLTRDVRPN